MAGIIPDPLRTELDRQQAETELIPGGIDKTIINTTITNAMLREAAQREFKMKIDSVAAIPTPPNVLEKREIGSTKDRTGTKVPIYADYVKLGYMQEIVRTHITADYKFRTIVSPHLVQIEGATLKGKTNIINPTYECFVELDIYLYGQLVHSIPSSGTCQIKNNAQGIEMASKGCVTDAYKKAFSYLKVCNDVYIYGDEIALTLDVKQMYIDEIKKDYENRVTEWDKDGRVSNPILNSQSIRSLRARYWTIRNRLDTLVDKQAKESK